MKNEGCRDELQALRAQVNELERRLAQAQQAAGGAAISGVDNSGAAAGPEWRLLQDERERLLEALGERIDRAEIDTLRAEERAGILAAVIDAMVDPVLILDEHGAPLFANAATAQALGLDPLQLDWRRAAVTFRAWNDEGGIPNQDELPMARALRGESIAGETWRFEDAAGQEHTVLVSAGPVRFNRRVYGGERYGAVVTWHDISERARLQEARQRAELALGESEQRFRELADSMPQLVWTANADGVVEYYNTRRSEYAGIELNADGGYTWAPAVHPDDLAATNEAWQTALRTGQTYQVEHRIRMADGSYRWQLSRGMPVRADDGRVVKWFGTATDIDDQKAAEENLRSYAERLERSNRDLQEFAFVASHDLQEPLRKIEMFGDLLLQHSDNLDERQRDFLSRMRDAAQRMRAMVDGLLQLSRLTTRAQPFEAVDLRRAALEAADALETAARAGSAHIEVEALPVVRGDALQMRQLFQNLIANALKFQPAGQSPQVRISAAPTEPGWVEIVVQDNGIGFDPQLADGLFQPFQRLVGRSQYPGSGMGLAICRRIVERHGGTISASAAPGQGATLRVRLPGASAADE